ncbi:MAG: hypothetical protein MUF46_07815 [Desulfobacterales bacterium]|nr:hypothetical protein [Desulfobacterales bacterium]
MAAPFSMMARSTPAAKRLSFHFFLTDAASMSSTLFEGRTRAAVATSPVSSSTAKSTFSMSLRGSTAEQIPQPWLTTARMISSGQRRPRRISSLLRQC